MGTLAVIVEELKVLSPDMLHQAAVIIHQLKERSQTGRKAGLMQTSGALTKEEADEWEQTIDADCEKVDESW
jgi:hypothetical protein